jgi:predicted nucleic acid-binding protein
MRYLLDVNALIALGITRHQFRDRVRNWISSLSANGTPELATCSITELGFVRIVSQIPAYHVTLERAKSQLSMLKASQAYDIEFLVDGNDVAKLPPWVKSSKQTTDGHLVQLAASSGCVLATLDERIPGAYLIPE